jgi:hypothetical protein
MDMRIRISVAVSLLLHGFLIGAGTFMFFRPERTPHALSPISVELVPDSATSSPPKSNQRAIRSRPRHGKVALGKLGVFSENWTRHSSDFTSPRGTPDAGHRDAYEIARTMSEEEAAGHYPALSFLHEKINSRLTYPVELASRGHSGKVSLQFDVTERGQLVGGFHSLRSEDRYLRVVVLRILRRALADPLPEAIRLPEKLMRLGAVFIFDPATRKVTLAELNIPSVLKNILTFYRQSNADGLNLWMKEEAQGGKSINTDIVRLFESIFKKKRDDDPDSPLQRYRDDPDW